MKSYVLKILVLAILILVIIFLVNQWDRTKPPNIVILLVDALRSDHLSCYGYPEPASPYIDLMTKKGTWFSDVSTPSSWTVPSITSFLTSTYQSVHGVTSKESVVPESLVTLSQIFKNNGYVTGAVVGNGHLDSRNGFDRGYDYYFEAWKNTDKQGEIPGIHSARYLNNYAIDWMEKNRNNNFFLYIHYLETHSPYLLPDDQPNLFYPDYTGSIPAHMGDVFRLSKDALWENAHQIFWDAFREERQDWDYVQSLYDTKIRFFDNQLARLLKHMKRLGILNNTIIVFLSDHGEGLGQHQWWEHGGKPYEEQIRIPLVFYKHGKKTRSPEPMRTAINYIDVSPTLLDICGIPPFERFQGTSLTSLMNADPNIQNNNIFSEVTVAKSKETVRSFRYNNWKLLVNETSKRGELYNLQTDPQETINLFNEEKEQVMMLFDLMRGRLIKNAALAPVTHKPAGTEIPDSNTIDALRSLGYIE